jgi:hypothetical protein
VLLNWEVERTYKLEVIKEDVVSTWFDVKDYYSKLVLGYQSAVTLNLRLCLSIELLALIIRIWVLTCAQSLSNTLKLQTLYCSGIWKFIWLRFLKLSFENCWSLFASTLVEGTYFVLYAWFLLLQAPEAAHWHAYTGIDILELTCTYKSRHWQMSHKT